MKVKGVDKVLKKLARFGEEADRKVKGLTMTTAREIAVDASQRAPVDMGTLSKSIIAVRETPYLWYVSVMDAYAPYAPYVEFGTGTNIEVPNEWKDLAWPFYKSGKGYMHPRPFLYPAYRKGIKQYFQDLKDLLEDLTRRHNQS